MRAPRQECNDDDHSADADAEEVCDDAKKRKGIPDGE